MLFQKSAAFCLCALLLFVTAPKVAADLRKGDSISTPVAEDTGEVTALLRTGSAQPGIVVILVWDAGKPTRIQVQPAPMTFTSKIKEKDNPAKSVTLALDDACIEFPELRIKLYVRPNLNCYSSNASQGLIRKWNGLTPASQYEFPLSLRLDAKGVEYWIDGRYAGRADKNGRLMEVVFQRSVGATVRDIQCGKKTTENRFLRLDIARAARPGLMKSAEVSLEAGVPLISGVPFIVRSGLGHADLGIAREMSNAAMELDPYLARTAFDGMPESILFSVPLNQYISAWVLCAAEDNPEKDAVLTARLTRFASDGHGGAIADTTAWLPSNGQRLGRGVNRVGSVSYTAKDGKKDVPLWLMEIPLKVGEIQDLTFIHKKEACNDGLLPDRRYLDFELLGKLRKPYPSGELSHKPDPGSTSGVHVFGVTLERTPVEMEVRPSQVGGVFQGNEEPEFQVVLRFLEPGIYALRWVVRDVDEKLVTEGVKALELNVVPGEQIIPLAPTLKDRGWYSINFILEDSSGRGLVEHSAAFALLAADTRRAGYESPYGTWWFGKAHRGTDVRHVGGPLMAKAGLRHTNFGWHKLTEADMAPWKVTATQVPWLWRGNAEDLAAKTEKYAQAVSDYLRKFPSCNEAIIFHESYSGDTVPPELRDAVPLPLAEKQATSAENRIATATAASKVLRDKFPQLKIVFGNCNSVSSLAAEFFRAKYPKEYIDYLGIEAAGQTFMPEKLTEWGTQAAWLARETAQKMGYELPVACCYEWLYRTQRDLGAKRLAEWYVRDALIAHAYHFPHISLGLLYDAGNCYYNTLWGGSGLCQRYPLLYPKPAYVAYATLTRVLDSVRLIRRVPTGSTTVYVLEFSRNNDRIYALWTPRGNCETTLCFDRDITVSVEDLYGRNRSLATVNGELTLTTGTAALYVISSIPVTGIIAGQRTFPLDQPPANLVISNAMRNVEEWKLVSEKDHRLEAPYRGYLPLRTAGQYSLRQADDPEKGSCLEIELLPDEKAPDIVSKYAVLNLKTPVPVPGRPTTLGVWVKGNSSWGRIMWSFEDAEGKRWLSSGTGGWGCDILDWPGDISINFDGWCFLRFPINEDSPVKVINPGGVAGQWVKSGKNKKVAYPIILTGLAVEMTHKGLDLTEMKSVVPILRFRDLCAY